MKNQRTTQTLLLASVFLTLATACPAETSASDTATKVTETPDAKKPAKQAATNKPKTNMPPQAKTDLPAPADVKAAPADAAKTASGLASKVLTAGKGKDHPAATETVKVHYTGWTTDGKMFDSSVARGKPASFPLNRVIKGWTEGLQLMVEGEKRRFWIPGNLAYGDTPKRPGAPAGTLVFDVELLEIVRPLPPPKAPDDVAAAPKDAKKTASGLSYRVLKAGTGAQKPKATDRVTVHYSGWTTDGKMFDSSITRGQPATFPLNGVIKGWTEGLQLMVVGEKTRFWIPGPLAYGDTPKRPGAPAGTLVFDVELISIQ
jgi:FKBP-type peptidyl-prolyl cis-trans isomerase